MLVDALFDYYGIVDVVQYAIKRGIYDKRRHASLQGIQELFEIYSRDLLQVDGNLRALSETINPSYTTFYRDIGYNKSHIAYAANSQLALGMKSQVEMMAQLPQMDLLTNEKRWLEQLRDWENYYVNMDKTKPFSAPTRFQASEILLKKYTNEIVGALQTITAELIKYIDIRASVINQTATITDVRRDFDAINEEISIGSIADIIGLLGGSDLLTVVPLRNSVRKKIDQLLEEFDQEEKRQQEEQAKREKEAREKAEREKAEKEAKEKAEKEAKEKAEKEAKEKAEKEAKEKAERAEREKKEKEEKEARIKAEKKKAEKEAADKLAKAKAEAEAKKKAAEEEERKRKEEAAAEAAAKKKKAEEEAEAKKKVAEEKARKLKEEAEAAKKKAEEEEAARKKAADEEEARRKAEEARKAKEAEEEAKRKAAELARVKEEEAKRKAQEEEAAKRKAEEEETKRKAEEAIINKSTFVGGFTNYNKAITTLQEQIAKEQSIFDELDELTREPDRQLGDITEILKKRTLTEDADILKAAFNAAIRVLVKNMNPKTLDEEKRLTDDLTKLRDALYDIMDRTCRKSVEIRRATIDIENDFYPLIKEVFTTPPIKNATVYPFAEGQTNYDVAVNRTVCQPQSDGTNISASFADQGARNNLSFGCKITYKGLANEPGIVVFIWRYYANKSSKNRRYAAFVIDQRASKKTEPDLYILSCWSTKYMDFKSFKFGDKDLIVKPKNNVYDMGWFKLANDPLREYHWADMAFVAYLCRRVVDILLEYPQNARTNVDEFLKNKTAGANFFEELKGPKLESIKNLLTIDCLKPGMVPKPPQLPVVVGGKHQFVELLDIYDLKIVATVRTTKQSLVEWNTLF